MHMHSMYSYDGKESLLSLRDFLLSKGISFCCMTEHTDQMSLEQAQLFVQECKLLTTSQFVFIPGFEVPYKNAHILLIGTEVFMGQQADADMLRTWSKSSVLTVLAHPVRNRFKIDSVMEEVLDGVEIWNQQYEGKQVPRTRSVQLLSELQKKKPTLLATGGLDFHRRDHFGSPLYSLEVDTLTLGAIVSKLIQGEYTFGTETVSVSSLGLWKGNGTLLHTAKSAYAVGLIFAGKKVNALLAYLGIPLPKWMVKSIRSRV